jgi:hypothetical protein
MLFFPAASLSRWLEKLMKRSFSTYATLGLAAVATACSGGSGSTSSNTSTGTQQGALAQVALMDAPPEGVTAVKLTVASMQVHVVPGSLATDAGSDDADAGAVETDAGEALDPSADAGTVTDDGGSAEVAPPEEVDDDGEGSWVTLDVDRTIDLVQHQGETAADILGQLQLPAGKITQLRLVLDTSVPENNVATLNGVDCNLDTKRVSKQGVKLNHVFKAFESKAHGTVHLWVDFDLEKSLKANKDGCFDLEPQLRLAHAKMDDQDVDL